MGTSKTSTVNSIPSRREERARRFDSLERERERDICLPVPGGRSRPQQITPRGAAAAAAALRSGTNPRRSRGSRARADPIARAPDRRTRRKNHGEGEKSSNRKSAMRFGVVGEETVGLGPRKRVETHRNRASAGAGGLGLGWIGESAVRVRGGVGNSANYCRFLITFRRRLCA